MFDASTMDGYAVRAADVGDAPLVVRGEARAGAVPPHLAAGGACRIFTGAPLPKEADAVIMQEDATREGDLVRFRTRPASGAFVRHRGDDLRAGDVALPRGTRLGARELALLSSLDIGTTLVARAPRVVIVPTGDELHAPGAEGAPPFSIAESNASALRIMATKAGALTEVLPPVRDEPNEIVRGLSDALAHADVLVTVGGVSVGEHDLVRGALERCGAVLDFWRVAMRPGKPLAVGRAGKAVVLGLPGNPVSAILTFAFFGAPLLWALQGARKPLPRMTRARLAEPVTRAKSDRLELARARFDEHGDVAVLSKQASAAIIGLCMADVIVRIPEGTERLEAGAEVDVYGVTELGL
jgi:molybdopterin molybdotransferase